MPANRKPKAWNLKPHLTAAPELWRELVFFIDCNSRKPRDHISGLYPTVRGTVTSQLSSVGIETETPSGGNNDLQYAVKKTLNPSIAYTWFGVCRFTDTSTNQFDFDAVPFGFAADTDGFGVSVNKSGHFFIFSQGGNSNGNVTEVVDDNKYRAFVAIWDQAQGRVVVDIDGVEQYDKPYTDTSSGTGSIYIGGLGDSNLRSFGASALQGFAAKRWSKEERLAFGKDPFAMLRPAGF